MSRVDEIRARLAAITVNPTARANGLFLGAAPEDLKYLLARVEKLEGLLKQMKPTSRMCWCDPSWDIERYLHMAKCNKARTLLADESKEDEHGSK